MRPYGRLRGQAHVGEHACMCEAAWRARRETTSVLIAGLFRVLWLAVVMQMCACNAPLRTLARLCACGQARVHV
jgi:hypothetical protein